jgi:UDP-N-acetylmuramoylalanine--D-glutamate ligase
MCTDKTITLSGTPDDGKVDLSELSLLGRHNQDNAAAAALLAVCAGVARESIKPAVLTALPHRLEPVHSARGITWVNDSKATNVDAAIVGISGIDAPLIVLLGGAGKAGSDYGRLNQALARSARRIICFGDAGPQIAAALDRPEVETVQTLRDAVSTAVKRAQLSDVVLLSPACASFDEFTNFEERGEHFKALAQEMSQ